MQVEFDCAQELYEAGASHFDQKLYEAGASYFDEARKLLEFIVKNIEHIDIRLDSKILSHYYLSKIYCDQSQLSKAITCIKSAEHRYSGISSLSNASKELICQCASAREIIEKKITNTQGQFNTVCSKATTTIENYSAGTDLSKHYESFRSIFEFEEKNPGFFADLYKAYCLLARLYMLDQNKTEACRYFDLAHQQLLKENIETTRAISIYKCICHYIPNEADDVYQEIKKQSKETITAIFRRNAEKSAYGKMFQPNKQNIPTTTTTTPEHKL